MVKIKGKISTSIEAVLLNKKWETWSKVSNQRDELLAVVPKCVYILLVPGVDIQESEDDDFPAPSITLAKIHNSEDSINSVWNSALTADKRANELVGVAAVEWARILEQL